jgi:GNAT superfamily N-acetyltransferase
MDSPFSLRQFGPADSAAYAELLAASPDTGSVGMVETFEIDPYQALMGLHSDTVGVVAETPGHSGLVGGGLIRFRPCQWEGQVLPSALLNTLVVHPAFRRRGLAGQLAKWREDCIRQRYGDQCVMWAIIQSNNTGSERTAQKWSSQFVKHRLISISMKMRSQPPASSRDFSVRALQPDDFEAVVAQQNRFYQDYNLYPPESAASLADWLVETPFDAPFRHYLVASDKAGQIQAGMALAETSRLRKTIITHLPPVLNILNKLVQAVPLDGVLRELGINRVWYAPGQVAAARYLLESVRWEWRERGSSLVLFSDVRSPLISLYAVRPWTAKTVESFALRGPSPCSEDRFFYYG